MAGTDALSIGTSGSVQDTSPRVRLFQVSFFILFLELACIRWFGSTVIFLTFFTNIVLIACFLGMSVGLMAARRQTDFIRYVMPLLALAMMLSAVLLTLVQVWPDLIYVDVGNQRSPAQIYFGTEYGNPDIARAVIPIELIAGVFFVLIALIFVGLGQEMGRAFDLIPNRIAAYTIDIVGSLLGIVVFSLLSYAWTNPMVWFSLAGILFAYILPRWDREQTIAAVTVLFIAGFISYAGGFGRNVIWSPYYKILYDVRNGVIETNNIGHQQMHDLKQNSFVYQVVHQLNRDAGLKPFEDVMIIGAGSGNDVTAALMNGAKRIDAVEIDPAINQIGKQSHPNQPYSDKRFEYVEKLPDGREVKRSTIVHQDGRQWMKQNVDGVAQGKPRHHLYDMTAYAVVDSLVLSSSYSGSLRLESFLFTEDAFRDMRANLKPGGVFAMYNLYRQPWVVGRLNKMAKDVFGSDPLVISMPELNKIDDDTTVSGMTVILVGVPDEGKTSNARLDAIRAKLAESKAYFVATNDAVARRVNGYATAAPAMLADIPPSDYVNAQSNTFVRIVPTAVEVKNIGPTPTDDWPQLYLKEAKISPEVWKSMLIMGGLSLIILIAFAPKGQGMMPNGRMFFLGAGFMLLETKGVVHMSLLFGSTWITNSVVFFAILVMILLANLFVTLAKPNNLFVYYVLLFAALVVNALVPMSYFLTLPDVWKTVASCTVVFLPVFFAGVIFTTSFRDSVRPDVDFGWNVAGVILGALSENFSMMLGFNYMIFIAIGFYLLSIPFGRRAAIPKLA